MVKVKRLKFLALAVVSFMLGLLVSNYNFYEVHLESPFSTDEELKTSPSDRITEQNIKLYDDKIVIYAKEPYLARFADTHSMEPVLDKNSNAIEIVPKSAAEVMVGDIISFIPKNSHETIIHRVVKIGHDSEGWYAVTKGDNNPYNDEEKVRFSQVERILVGILY